MFIKWRWPQNKGLSETKDNLFLMMMNVGAGECEYPWEGGKCDFSETGGG